MKNTPHDVTWSENFVLTIGMTLVCMLFGVALLIFVGPYYKSLYIQVFGVLFIALGCVCAILAHTIKKENKYSATDSTKGVIR